MIEYLMDLIMVTVCLCDLLPKTPSARAERTLAALHPAALVLEGIKRCCCTALVAISYPFWVTKITPAVYPLPPEMGRSCFRLRHMEMVDMLITTNLGKSRSVNIICTPRDRPPIKRKGQCTFPFVPFV